MRAVASSVLAGFLLSQLLGRQLVQLIVHQRKQLLRAVRIAVLDSRQNARHFTLGAGKDNRSAALLPQKRAKSHQSKASARDTRVVVAARYLAEHSVARVRHV